MNLLTAEEVIAALGLEPHPLEGGFFRETYRTGHMHGQERPLATGIYYLLTPQSCSALHRLPGDELFHFYLGDPVRQLQLYPDGAGKEFTLGTDLAAGQVPQLVVTAGAWQGSHLLGGPHGFALLGATMAPGFDYADYATSRRGELTARWPAFAELIAKLTPRG